ncbi:MAG: hypothetical protein HY537_18050 [Deltaproteobacteria bacterium]|nr:hypothetical protein [Deltaproteobacteria bacterium]
MSQVIEIVDKVLQDYPALERHLTEEGVEIWLSERGDKEDTEYLVGFYSHRAIADAEITEADIRDDCEAFMKSKK